MPRYINYAGPGVAFAAKLLEMQARRKLADMCIGAAQFRAYTIGKPGMGSPQGAARDIRTLGALARRILGED